MLQEVNALPTYSMDDICDCLIKESDPGFIKKSEALDILNRYANKVFEAKKRELETELSTMAIAINAPMSMNPLSVQPCFQPWEVYI